jgi:vacuole morphology and inheritance protein 14
VAYFSDEYGLLQITALRWIEAFFTICPEELLPFTPKLLEKVLPALAPVYPHHQAAHKGNESLTNLILSVPSTPAPAPQSKPSGVTPRIGSISGASVASTDGGDSASVSKETQNESLNDPFDYYATVNSLTLQFLNEHEETRVAAFDWLIMLHKKAPNKVISTFDDVDCRF